MFQTNLSNSRINSSENDNKTYEAINPNCCSAVNNINDVDIEEEIEMNKISFQFNNSVNYIINLPLNFDIVIGFEYN